MRIWNISPRYLNRQSLLGEHRELHGIVSIIMNGKKGYSNHSETIRWVGYGWALNHRHSELTSEMALRGFTDKSPVEILSNKELWPQTYIDDPGAQFKLLEKDILVKSRGVYHFREANRNSGVTINILYLPVIRFYIRRSVDLYLIKKLFLPKLSDFKFVTKKI